MSDVTAEEGVGGGPQRGCRGLRIVVVSFEFGPGSGPEGVCSARLVEAMERAGAEITVITRACEAASAGRSDGVVTVGSRFERPTRPQAILGTALAGGWSSHWWWVRSAAAVRIEGDVIYARGNPLSSLLAGRRLARRLGLPFAAHFSDPIPSPWDGPGLVRAIVMRTVRRVVNSATVVTFSTPEGMEYEGDALAQDLRTKSVVVRNIVPEWEMNWRHQSDQTHTLLLYAGGFGGRRYPDPLAHGVARAARVCGTALGVRFVGTGAESVERFRRIVGPTVVVECKERIADVRMEYEAADVVLVIDADDSRPVFLATKTVEAVHAGRRVLIVSPPGSPAFLLFANRWASVRVTPQDPDSICQALLGLLRTSNSVADQDIPARRMALAEFRGEHVAQALLASFSALVGDHYTQASTF